MEAVEVEVEVEVEEVVEEEEEAHQREEIHRLEGPNNSLHNKTIGERECKEIHPSSLMENEKNLEDGWEESNIGLPSIRTNQLYNQHERKVC